MRLPYLKSVITISLCLFATFHMYSQSFTYPETRKAEQIDDYFGTKVNDPYRWLEDDNSAETAAWVTQQNATTEDYLSKIPFRTILYIPMVITVRKTKRHVF